MAVFYKIQQLIITQVNTALIYVNNKIVRISIFKKKD